MVSELPPIQSFQLNNILDSIQDDSVSQLIQSVQTVMHNFNNDLNQELADSIRFQSEKISTLTVKNHKLVKSFKVLGNSPRFKIDQELVDQIKTTSERTKDLIEKLYKWEKLLPSKERLFNEQNSHRLHYPTLYAAGNGILDLEDDLVSLSDAQGVGAAAEAASESDAETDADAAHGDQESGAVAAESSGLLATDHGVESSVESSTEPEQEGKTGSSPIEAELQKLYQNAQSDNLQNLKDQRIAMLSKNIDDIISESAQQQQLQHFTKPTSLIFPTHLTKKTSSQFNEDVRAILIKRDSKDQRQAIFGLKKFL